MEIADQYAGQTGKCKKCGKPIVVPASGPVSAFKQVPQAQTAAVPYKWIAATAAIIVVLALGIYILVSRDTPVSSSRGASAPVSSSPKAATSGRIVNFPNDRRVGQFWLRDKLPNGSWTQDWGERQGGARGPRTVPEGKEAGLYISNRSPVDLSFLKNFAPNDLDYLFILHRNMTDEQLPYVSHLTGIKEFKVQWCGVGDTGIRHLSGLTQVTQLSLQGTNVTDAGISSILGMKDLKGLHIAGTKITDVGIRRLKVLPGLIHLSLSSDQITAPTVMALEELPSVVSLTIFTDEGDISLAERPLTPRALRLLANLGQLSHLGLTGHRHDDSLIPALAQLTGLKRLKLNGTSITPARISELRRALPNCQITQ